MLHTGVQRAAGRCARGVAQSRHQGGGAAERVSGCEHGKIAKGVECKSTGERGHSADLPSPRPAHLAVRRLRPRNADR
eukprot:7311018-Prymnesium_polylepis.2